MSTSPPRIILTVRADGSATAVTEGMHGDSCLDYIAVLENLIDGTTTSSAFTDDYTRVAATVDDGVVDTLHLGHGDAGVR